MSRQLRSRTKSDDPKRAEDWLNIHLSIDPDFLAAVNATSHETARVLRIVGITLQTALSPVTLISLPSVPDSVHTLLSSILSDSCTLALHAISLQNTRAVATTSQDLRLINVLLTLVDSNVADAMRASSKMSTSFH